MCGRVEGRFLDAGPSRAARIARCPGHDLGAKSARGGGSGEKHPYPLLTGIVAGAYNRGGKSTAHQAPPTKRRLTRLPSRLSLVARVTASTRPGAAHGAIRAG